MVEDNVLPFQYMRNRSLFQLIYLGIISSIFFPTSFVNFSNVIPTRLAITATLYIISCFIKASLILNVIYNFSSQSVSFLIVSESLAGSIKGIIDFFDEENNTTTNIVISIIEIILLVLIGITTMIYEEIIVFRFWGLEKDVREEISNRASIDNRLVHSYTIDD